MSKPLIVCDEQIPFAGRAFSLLGRVELLPAARISARSIRKAEVLIVRSVTRVGPGLLRGTRVKVVGSVTSGTDHIDTGYLEQHRVSMVPAPGSNAEAVAEYVIASLLVLGRQRGFDLRGMTVGVIGVGHVGTLVDRKCRALGMRTILNDPPLARATADPKYRPLAELFKADIITLHVPLNLKGRDRTYHLVDRRFLARLERPVILINTSRGKVADETAVRLYAARKMIAGLVIDVWPHEPEVDPDLLGVADIATPHIAGYSLDGKVRAAETVLNGIARIYGIPDPPAVGTWLRPPKAATIGLTGPAVDREAAIRDAVFKVYDPRRDDRRLRRILGMDVRDRPGFFEQLRRAYPARREFGQYRITAAGGTGSIGQTLVRLGFRIPSSR